jgi:hypothetical protein
MHHDRLDGTGYHRGSRARDLNVFARVLAAAVAFQAMTEKRPTGWRLVLSGRRKDYALRPGRGSSIPTR